MPIFRARNGHETNPLIYFQERKIREKLLLNEGTMMKVFRVIRLWCKKVFRNNVRRGGTVILAGVGINTGAIAAEGKKGDMNLVV